MEVFEELPGMIREVSKKRVESVVLPKREPGGGCIVAGVLPMELRKLYVVWENSKEEIKKIDKQFDAEVAELRRKRKLTKKRQKEIQQQNYLAHSRYRDIERSFWSAVCKKFPEIFEAQSTFIRESWEVVIVISSSQRLHVLAFCEPSCSLGEALKKMITNNLFTD